MVGPALYPLLGVLQINYLARSSDLTFTSEEVNASSYIIHAPNNHHPHHSINHSLGNTVHRYLGVEVLHLCNSVIVDSYFSGLEASSLSIKDDSRVEDLDEVDWVLRCSIHFRNLDTDRIHLVLYRFKCNF